MGELNETFAIEQKDIERLIYTVRGQKVMLDSDLAKIYGYEIKRLNEQVKRNIRKFPEDFMFQLTDIESECLRSQFATANISNMSRYNPFVFTEQGIYMLMTVLKGDLAEKQSIALVRVFKQMKDFISDCNKPLVSSEEFYKLATLTAENSAEISRIKNSMLEKEELDRVVKSFRQTAGKFHDRYIVLDYKTKNEKIYHCGASSKDAGKRTTSISLVEDNTYYHGLVDMLLQNPVLNLK